MPQPRGRPFGGRSSLKLRRTTLRRTQWGQLDDRIQATAGPFTRGSVRSPVGRDPSSGGPSQPYQLQLLSSPPSRGRGSRRGSLNPPGRGLVLARRCRVHGLQDSYLVDSASSHMLVSKIKPCMSKYKQSYCETANGSLNQLSFI